MKPQQFKKKPGGGGGGTPSSSTPQTDAANAAQKAKEKADAMLKDLGQAVKTADSLIKQAAKPKKKRQICYCGERGCRIGPFIEIEE